MKYRVGFSALAFVAASMSLVSTAAAQEDYSTWAHTEFIKVNTASTGGGAGVATTITGFPVLVRLTSAQATVFAQAKAGGADVRFRRIGGPVLPYQIERWDSAGKVAEIWVRLDSVYANNSTQTFNMYWGKSTAMDSSKSASVFRVADAFQGVWHFGGNLNDATSNGITGTPTGTTEAAGAIGLGRYFDGGSSISLGNPAGMNLQNPFTIEAWVKWESIGTGSVDRYRTIISHGSGATGGEFFLHAKNASGVEAPYYSFGHYPNPTNAAETVPGDYAADANTWVHLGAIYDGTSWLLYRNGSLVASNGRTGTVLNATTPWYIGAFGTNTVTRWNLGSLDEIRFASAQRSPDWVKLSYETQKTGATAVVFGTPASLRDAGASQAESFGVASSNAGVTFALPAGSGRVLLTVSDMRGKVLWSREANLGSSLTWSAKGLPAGTYAARMMVKDGAQAGRSFQKQFVLGQ
jgi:hypothetical protein